MEVEIASFQVAVQHWQLFGLTWQVVVEETCILSEALEQVVHHHTDNPLKDYDLGRVL